MLQQGRSVGSTAGRGAELWELSGAEFLGRRAKLANVILLGPAEVVTRYGSLIGHLWKGTVDHVYTTRSESVIGICATGGSYTNCGNFLNYSLEQKVQALGAAFTGATVSDGLPKLLWEVD